MKVTVFGMGYVGTVASAYLSGIGHDVQCVEPNESKINELNRGDIPFYEPTLKALWYHGHEKTVAAHPNELPFLGEASIICVGTPPVNGFLQTNVVRIVIEQIMSHRSYDEKHRIIIRSTMPVGACQGLMEQYDMYNLTFMPEFLREGRAIHDIEDPSLACYASTDKETGMMHFMQGLWDYPISDMYYYESFEDAEMLKLACNAWHATKIVFTNEISRLCQSVGADSKSVMGGLCNDVVLNISSHYMNPGFSYGGSCLPKDVSELNNLAATVGVSTPLLDNLHTSNDKHTKFTHDVVLNLIKACHTKDIYILGVAFKADTDDLRNSEVVYLIYQLLASRFETIDYKIHIVDPYVSNTSPELISMMAANDKYISLATISEATEAVGLGGCMLVVTQENKIYKPIYKNIKGGQVIDLFNMSALSKDYTASAIPPNSYHGLSW